MVLLGDEYGDVAAAVTATVVAVVVVNHISVATEFRPLNIH